ncbi:MAG: hypothetical protein AAF541_18405 [Pseudomonadota bacterium]
MRPSLVLICWLFSGVAHALSCEQTPAEAAAPELAQFHFLVGQHTVQLHAWTGHAWTPPRPISARWNGWYGLEGMAIYDEWIDPDPQRGGLGVNVRTFDAKEKQWKMMWVSTTGLQVLDLRAQILDGVLTMWQAYPARPGWQAKFEILSEDSWQRIDYTQDESGEWQPGFRLVAKRTACP